MPEEMKRRKGEAIPRGEPRENGAMGYLPTGDLTTKIHQPQRP